MPRVARRCGLSLSLPFVLALVLAACRSRGAVEIAAGKDNTCLRTQDGRVYCWGDDAYTQTKNPSFAAKPGVRTAPKRVNAIDEARGLSLAASHGCASVKSGGLRCFLDVDLEGVSISGADVTAVRTFVGGVCALTAGGEVKCFRGEPREIPRSPADPPKGISGVVDIATGERHVCVAHGDGTVTCFGDDRVGQLGPLASETAPSAEAQPPAAARKVEGLKDVASLTAGQAHTCALLKSGRVACWGLNELGQLGRTPKTAADAVDRSPVAIDGLEGVTAVAAGYYHTCAVVRGGAVYCWGSNHHGELGRPATRAVVAKPERVDGIDGVTQVACGEWHTCAVIAGGAVKCWGRNHRGQLGTGNNTDSHKPVEVKLP